MNQLSRQNIDNFFSAIDGWKKVYKNSYLSYLAFQNHNHLSLIQGRLIHAIEPFELRPKLMTPNVIACQHRLSDLDFTPRQLLDNFLSENLRVPEGILRFPKSEDSYNSYYQPFHSEGLATYSRLSVLTIDVPQRTNIQELLLDWELKAASTPYDSLLEVALNFGLGPLRTDRAVLEVAAHTIMYVDLGKSVTGNKAQIGVRMAKDLNRRQATLGYRVMNAGNVIERSSINGKDLKWEKDGSMLVGSAEIEVPKASAVHCYAGYKGVVHHQGWVADPTIVLNPRRASYEPFDPKLNILKEFVSQIERTSQPQRDFEYGISSLLWLLGFDSIHLGSNPRTQEAPDIVVTTPKGNFIVVECTIGLLKTENKIARLIDRTEAIRKSLSSSNITHVTVLSAIVTSKTKMEVRAELEAVEQLGVLVITKETLMNAIERTLMFPNPDQIFQEAVQEVETLIRKHQGEPGLPFPKTAA